MTLADEDISAWEQQGDVDSLVDVVRDPGAGHLARIDAVKALGKIGAKERTASSEVIHDREWLSAGTAKALDPLLAAVRDEDEDEDVQYWARDAVESFGEPALEPLMALRHDPDKWVRNTALLGLQVISVVDEGSDRSRRTRSEKASMMPNPRCARTPRS